jgi:hypothetical protein
MSRHGGDSGRTAGQSSQRPAARANRRSSSERAVRQRPRSTSDGRAVDRDRLLQGLFPNGIPAREEVIREVNAWLDQAERLARLR